MATDADAVVYLMLVNNLLHDTFPSCITIGECIRVHAPCGGCCNPVVQDPLLRGQGAGGMPEGLPQRGAEGLLL